MKTLRATFTIPGGAQASAEASFATLPGESAVTWSGHVGARRTLRRVDGKLPLHAYADNFEGWMRWLAQRAGAQLKIEEEGDWQVFEE